ncbi:YdhR family protein [Thiocapsa marina]|uniref:Putative mono-oxygenase ydhR n=1 Tax=Thiocapsa marina 5811 TaxID=768671 RepID=F9UE42_9GAMM|nr:YdhR family protein [Thiocapsa marina]EGV17599.1 Putative mono-oxygenase ydhR [Thiocapsa marina 5811]
MTQLGRVFLYAEFQASVPFNEGVWREANATMQSVPGLRSKTWLSGINTHSVGGFYEFDSEQNARNYAEGMLAEFAKAAGASLTVKQFDGDVVAEASKGMNSPFFAI